MSKEGSALTIEAQKGHFRFYSYPVTFFGFPAVVVVPLMLAMFHIRTWTIGLAVIIGIFFWIIGKFGYTPTYAWYAFRAWMAGPVCSRTYLLGDRRMTRT